MQTSTLLSRRRLLGAAAVTAAVGLVNPATAVSFAPRSVSLYNTHTGEWLRTVYWADGHYIREAVRDINWILRDHDSDEIRPMNAGVLDLLGRLRGSLDTHDPFLVVCGYRSPTTNRRLYLEGVGVAKHSYHIKGMAVDLRSERRSIEQIRDAALGLRCGGVGYYPRSGFVHVDCGPVRQWRGSVRV
ncbi:MAG TPA: DUF882 domain-containing protein [Stellaceae bacterium]|nr:DUF882 domain-containing protein [Stellaceae bacterium]